VEEGVSNRQSSTAVACSEYNEKWMPSSVITGPSGPGVGEVCDIVAPMKGMKVKVFQLSTGESDALHP